jgi:hypothetical protein
MYASYVHLVCSFAVDLLWTMAAFLMFPTNILPTFTYTYQLPPILVLEMGA